MFGYAAFLCLLFLPLNEDSVFNCMLELRSNFIALMSSFTFLFNFLEYIMVKMIYSRSSENLVPNWFIMVLFSCREALCWDLRFWRASWPAMWWPGSAPPPSWGCCWEPSLACTQHRTTRCPTLKGRWKSTWTAWRKDQSSFGWPLPVTQKGTKRGCRCCLIRGSWRIGLREFCLAWTGISSLPLTFISICFSI